MECAGSGLLLVGSRVCFSLKHRLHVMNAMQDLTKLPCAAASRKAVQKQLLAVILFNIMHYKHVLVSSIT